MAPGPAATLFFLLAGLSNGAVQDFHLQKIGNGIWAAIVNDQGLAGGNAGFVIGDDGVLVIDTFQDPRPAKALLAEIRKLTPLPIRFVVNTHYHLDHVNGNDVFAATGATIVAHRNVRAWMRTENIKMLDPPVTPEKKARVESLTLPTVVHDSHIELYLGSRRINVRYYPGHTGGDSVVSIPDAHVVFCGDMLWKEHVPNLIDASTKAWIESLDAILAHELAHARRRDHLVNLAQRAQIGKRRERRLRRRNRTGRKFAMRIEAPRELARRRRPRRHVDGRRAEIEPRRRAGRRAQRELRKRFWKRWRHRLQHARARRRLVLDHLAEFGIRQFRGRLRR